MKIGVHIAILTLALWLIPSSIVAYGADRVHDDPVPDYLMPVAEILSRGEEAMMPVDGNEVRVFVGGQRKWESVIEDITSARRSIYMEYYRWTNDDAGRQIRDAVLKKIKEGLDVRIMLEDISNPLYSKEFYMRLKRAGAQVAFFTDTDRPLPDVLPGINTRDHRKIIVIDDEIGYTGGMNLGVSYRDIWRDTHVRVKGPAVAQLRKLFVDMWIARRGPEQNNALPPSSEMPEIQPSGDKTLQFATSGGGDTLLQDAVCRILESAKSYVYIQTPYFCPTPALLQALQSSALRGVDVRVVVPKETDSKLMTVANQSFFAECISSGVKIFEYEVRFNHSKVVLCDGCLSVIGSLNMDSRSLCINYEAVAAIFGTEVGDRCMDDYSDLLEHSHEVTSDDLNAWNAEDKQSRAFWRKHSGQL